jgi:hypothetical protein
LSTAIKKESLVTKKRRKNRKTEETFLVIYCVP